MATKHFYPAIDGLVDQALLGTAASNPGLALLRSEKVLYAKNHPRSQVSVICGGGSGHEPAHAGFVGEGMLAAAVCGDVFASPSAKQVQKGCMTVPSDQGYILIVTNYTGDMLHFGLACEKMKAEGYKVGVVKAADDVAVGRKNGGMVGRRGLAGTIILDKILGSMASADCSFDEIMTLGTAVGVSLVTISAGLDHCHVPGRTTAYGAIEGDTLEIGMGIHNEPGVRTVTPIPPIDDLIAELLQYLIDPNDADRAYVPFQKTDEIVVLINNLGGVSTLELRAATQATIAGLKTIHGIVPSRVVAGTFMTSLNAPAFAITLLNITHAARESGVDASQILEYFDAPTDALSWPKTAPYSADAAEEEAIEDESEKSFAEDITVNPATLERKLRKACENIIEIEPKLTEWDTEMGDGDCGETIKAGAVALLDLLDSGLAKTGSILRVVDAMVDITEDHMGGTLGAVFGIFFAALMSALVAAAGKPDAPIEQVLATATAEALASLRTHTPAKEGDRTVMDVMIPFSAAFDGGNVEKAAKAAKEAAEGTMKLMPKLGRATYVGGLAGRDLLPPDPGAWGVHELIQGLAE
ncbi:Dak1 domain-containing protein [Kockiozyma suomiensis]|uniref:Dak1 domain-containing protein n=1 Tax=Kockiozyma suomiensis TaxID=1337062 RepID=UPI003342E813